MLCAIHQPNFFPWLGYFDKIRRADVFVFLDDVDYPKSGSGLGSWVNRVKIDIQGEPAWWGARIVREHGAQKIRSVMLDDAAGWREKALRTLEQSYARAPFASQGFEIARELVRYPEQNLAAFNINAVRALGDALGVSARFVRQSELGVPGKATQLLVNLCKAVGADAYLEGMGAAYQDDALFAANGVHLAKQDFTPPVYRANGPLGLSVLDFLMHAEAGDLFKGAT